MKSAVSFNKNSIILLNIITIQIIISNVINNVISHPDFRYHSNIEIHNELVRLTTNQNESDILNISLISIGQTRGYINGSCVFNQCQRNAPNNLWVIEITAANFSDKFVPNIKLIGNINGDEPVGTEILLQFAWFLKQNFNKLPLVTWLLSTTKIHILPSLNPDEYTGSTETNTKTKLSVSNPYIHFKEIRNSFPSIHYPTNTTDDVRPVETLAIMKWMKETPFVLSAALYSGGGKGVSYPYDAPRKKVFRENNLGPHPTPDNDVFEALAKIYVENHGNMAKSTCPYSVYRFRNGIINGAIHGFSGSMSDYNYDSHGCFELSLRLDCRKYPKSTKLEQLWKENTIPLLKFLSQAHQGVSGQILDKENLKPVFNVTLKIKGRNITFETFKSTNRFWRLLLPGNYTLMVIYAKGYHLKSIDFEIPLVNRTLNKDNNYPRPVILNVLLRNESYPSLTPVTTIKSTTQERLENDQKINNSTRIAMRFSHKITDDEILDRNFNNNRANSYESVVSVLYIVIILLVI